MNKKLFIFILFTLLGSTLMAQPSITLSNPNATVCYNTTIVAFAYSTTESPAMYKITGSAAFLNTGNYQPLPAGSINIGIPVNTPAGIYTASIRVADATETDISEPVSLSITVLPTFSKGSIATIGQTVCPNAPANPINSTANASGGDGNITYEWRRNGMAILSSNFPTFTPTDSGTYTRYAKDNTCNTSWVQSTGIYTVNIRPAFTAGTIAATGETVCNNAQPATIGNTTSASGGDGTITYRWKVNGSIISGSNSAAYTPPAQTIAGIYNYTREAKDNSCTNGEWRASQGIWTLTVLPAFTAGSIATTGQTVCAHSQANTINNVTNASGGDGNITYKWQKNGTDLNNSENPAFTPTEAGTYTRWAKDTKCNTGWTKSSGEWVLAIRPEFTAGAIAATGETVCNNAQPATIGNTTSASGGDGTITYRWKVNGSIISGSNSAAYTPPAQTIAGIYNYTREAKDNSCTNGEWRASQGIWTLTVLPAFTAGSIATTGQTVCPNAPILTIDSDTNASGGDGNITYKWQKDGTDLNNSENPAFTPADSGTYTRYAKDNTCNTSWVQSTGSYTVTVRPAFTAGTIASTGETVCNNAQPLQIGNTTSAFGGDNVITYQWKVNGVPIADSINATYTPPAQTAARVYTYAREAKDGSCTNGEYRASQGTWTLIVLPSFTAGRISSIGQTVCLNTQANTIGSDTNASGGNGNISYRWKKDGSIIDGATASVYTPLTNGSGTFRYTRETKDGNCSNWAASSGLWILTVRPQFTSGSIAATGETICANAQPSPIGSITAASGGGGTISYRWRVNDVLISDATDETYTPPLQMSTGTYDYTREAKDGSCVDWTISEGSYRLVVNTASIAPQHPMGETLFCQGVENSDYEIILAPNAESYIWDLSPASSGTVLGNGNKISVLWKSDYTGTAHLKVKAKNVCSESAYSESLAITIQKAPEVSFIQAPNPVCANQKELVYAVEGIENAIYQWTIEKGRITSEIDKNKITVDWDKSTMASTGKIAVIVTDNTSECTYTASLSVAIAADNAPDLNAIVPKKDKNGNPYMLIYPNPSGNFIYQWYKNNLSIAGATEQFYYPANFNQILEKDAEYKVYVSDLHSVSCGNFTGVYNLTSQSSAKQIQYISIFPNPTNNGRFTVSFNRDCLQEGSGNYLLIIYSIAGEKVWEQKVSTLDNIVISQPLVKGTYILVFYAGKQRYTEKFLVE